MAMKMNVLYKLKEKYNMKILAIDTTTKKATVALKTEDNIYLKELDNEITHSEKLLPLLDEVLKMSNNSLKDVDLFALTLGPGSFTGVRISIATIKAIAKVMDKKIFGTTSLELLALDGISKASFRPKYVLSLMDAKNSRVYYNLYKYEDEKLLPLDFLGNDYINSVLEKIADQNLDNLLITIDNKDLNVQDAIIANLNLTNIFNLDLTSNLYDYLTLDAMYYRKSEAERTKEGE